MELWFSSFVGSLDSAPVAAAAAWLLVRRVDMANLFFPGEEDDLCRQDADARWGRVGLSWLSTEYGVWESR